MYQIKICSTRPNQKKELCEITQFVRNINNNVLIATFINIYKYFAISFNIFGYTFLFLELLQLHTF